MHVVADRVDDLLRAVFRRLLRSRSHICPSQGPAKEEVGVLLQLTNARARLSRTENRSTLFSCLGELLWYLAGSDRLDFIKYYIRRYERSSDDGATIFGAYGPRLFNMRGRHDQISNVLRVLKTKRDSRQAVIQLFDANDLEQPHADIPCTCTLQFMLRDSKLHLMVHMRSNDAFLGLPHDVFAFTVIQELVACLIKVEIGQYHHSVGSLHLYNRDEASVRQYLREDWQALIPMPPMPSKKPWASVRTVLKAERLLRTGRPIDVRSLVVDDYWKDIVRLLQIYRLIQTTKSTEPKALRTRAEKRISVIRAQMSSHTYDLHISRRLPADSIRKSRPAAGPQK